MARVRVEVPVEATPEQHVDKKDSRGLPYKKFFLAIAIIISFIYISNLINDKKELEKQVKGSQTTNSVEQVVEQLSKGVEIPADETPQMRTIDDAARFTQQNPSLSDIKNGDQLLFYEKSKKVVVYRPSTKKAVVVVTLATPEADSTQNTPQ